MTGVLEVSRAISGFRPYGVDARCADFAKAVTQACGPRNKSRAKSLLHATSRLAEFGQSAGLELRFEVLLHPSVIERFCAIGMPGVTPATRRTVRSNLRYVAARVLEAQARPIGLPRERAKASYTDSEISSYLALAEAQPTEARRMHATGLICLGAGAGLMGADLRSVRGRDVCLRYGAVMVGVSGARPRAVPVIARFSDLLLRAADFADDGFVIGGESGSRKNVTTPLVRSIAGGSHLPPLQTGRLRATWLSACAKAIGLRAFMDAAGISCSQRLGDIVARLDPMEEQRAVELLGAKR